MDLFREGRSSGFWFMSLMSRMAFPESFTWGELAAVARADNLAAKRYFASGRHRADSILGNPGTEFVYAGGGLVHAWPAAPDQNQYVSVRDSNFPTLLIGGTLDFATPAVDATRELLPHLPNGHQVVLRGIGHTTSFWTEQPKASTRLLNTFFDSGKVDASLYVPGKVEFTPEVTQTALGKGFAATMIVLPMVAMFSLLLMWRRSRKRGRFSRTASTLVRSVFVFVLGLGGWFAGVVVALVAFPTVPIDAAFLAVLCIGVPIGLGIYLAWVDRSSSAKRVGLLAAMAGALVGAWLGFHATTGLLAVITTIGGAAVVLQPAPRRPGHRGGPVESGADRYAWLTQDEALRAT